MCNCLTKLHEAIVTVNLSASCILTPIYARLPGGAGEEINELVGGWQSVFGQGQDYAVVTQGQLKALAALFYARLTAAGLANGVPWDQPGLPATAHYAAANIGQAKQLFSFVLPNPGDYGSGTSSLPLTLTVLSGNHQSVTAGSTTTGPLVVRATREGLPWAGVAVTFQTGSGTLGSGGQARTVSTNASGDAAVSYTAATGGSGTQAVNAVAEDAAAALAVTVTGTPGPGGGDPTGQDPDPPTVETPVDWDALYEIGLQKRSRSVDSYVWVFGSGWPDPNDPATADDSLTFEYWAYLDDDVDEDNEIWSGSCTTNTSTVEELAAGAAAVRSAVADAEMPAWEAVEPAGADGVAVLSQSGAVEAYATLTRGAGAAKAEFRLVRRLREGATAPVDADNHPIQPPAVTRHFLKVTRIISATASPPPAPRAEPVEFTIEANKEISTTTTGELFPPLTTAGEHHISLLPVEINVNDTADAKDDMVRKEQKIGTTAWRQWIPCTVKIPESGPGKTITSIGVTAESGTMKFSDAQAKPGDSDAGAANVNVTLDAQGQGKFWITGITQSTNKGDSKLQIRKNGATGDVLATQSMTVFWFDATITFPSQSAASKAGDLYGITNPQYAWTFSGDATIKPSGLDSTAPQIANMRLGFVQNVQTTRKWHVNNPTVQAGSGAPSSSTVTVASTRIGTVTWQSYVLDRRSPQSRMLRDQTPLYDGYEAFDTSGKSTINNDDSPQAPADTHSKAAQAVQGNQTWPVTVDYQWEKTVIQDDFLLWLGVADVDNTGWLPNPPSVVPIRQVDWKFHADSSANGLQTPTGGTHKVPDTVPVVTGQTANQRGANPANYQWQDGNQNTNLHP